MNANERTIKTLNRFLVFNCGNLISSVAVKWCVFDFLTMYSLSFLFAWRRFSIRESNCSKVEEIFFCYLNSVIGILILDIASLDNSLNVEPEPLAAISFFNDFRQ